MSLPILVGYGVKVDSLGDRGAVECNRGFAQMCFALKRDPFNYGYSNSYWNIEKGAKLQLKGTCRLSKGTILNIFQSGELVIGDGCTGNANLLISCAKKIEIGDDVLIGWDITIMDNDGGHDLMSCIDDKILNEARPVKIGDHVWIATKVSILKGTEISNNTVVGYNSLLCGLKCKEQNVVLAGSPAAIIKKDIDWKH